MRKIFLSSLVVILIILIFCECVYNKNDKENTSAGVTTTMTEKIENDSNNGKELKIAVNEDVQVLDKYDILEKINSSL